MRALRVVVFVLVQWTPLGTGAVEIIQRSNQSLRQPQPLAPWEQQQIYTNAREHIGLLTQEPAELRLYVSVHSTPNRELYVHSNFRPPITAEHERPRGETRLIARGVSDMAALVDEILVGTTPHDPEPSEPTSTKATLLVEHSVLESVAFRDLDFSRVGTSLALCNDGQARRFRGMLVDRQPKVWAVQYAASVYAPLSKQGRGRPWRYVAQSPFEPETVRTMSWLMDTTFNETLAQRMQKRNLTIDWNRSTPLDDITQQIELSGGQTVLAIGEIVDGSLVARAADGTHKFSVPLSTLKETALALDVRMMLLDRSFAQNTAEKPADASAAGDAMSRTARALAHSVDAGGTSTVLGFLSNLAREMARSDGTGEDSVVALVQSPPESETDGEESAILTLETTIHEVQWSGDSMHVGEPATRILYFRPTSDPYAAKSRIVAVRIGVALLSVLAVGILIGFYAVLKRMSPRADGTPPNPQLPIHLYYLPLQELNLADQTVDDSALAQLSSLPNIKRLHLSGPSVTDAGLKSIAECKSLEIVTLRQTNVSDRGVTWLRHKLPSCRVLEE